MTRGDVKDLFAKMQSFYGGKALEPSLGMLVLWHDALETFEETLVLKAVQRWARQHTATAPSLDELLEQIELLEDEERSLVKRSGSSQKSFLDVLKDAVEAQASHPLRSEDDVTYGRLMALLAERSIERWQDKQGHWHEKLTIEQRGEQCYAWARHYETLRPDLSNDLRAAARMFGAALYARHA